MAVSKELSCETESFSPCHLNPHRCFQSEVLKFCFPALEPWVARSILLQLFLPVYHKCRTAECTSHRFTRSAIHHLACPSPLAAALPLVLSSFLSPPLLLVWMNISCLTFWLSDFHTIQFYVSSGCFLLLNLMLPFFWLCEEAQFVYLCLHVLIHCLIACYSIAMSLSIYEFFPWGWFLVSAPCGQRKCLV